jgi:hypothetical protein
MKLSARLALLILASMVLLATACQPTPPVAGQVFIEADGQRQAITLQSGTVREALAQAGITLGKLDRVKPDLYTQLEPGLTIVVTRVTEEMMVEREVIPYERQTIINEALAAAETRLAQLGTNGEVEITLRVVKEDGQETSRTEIARNTLTAPVPEIMVIGPQGAALPAVDIEGTIAYISNGEAWLMRSTNTSRRALTTHSQLDEQVFALSPDSRQLLYTTALTHAIDLPLNELWLVSTTIVGEPPLTTGIRGVLSAVWSPVVSPALVAYSTAERSANPPGWQANNDLWLVSPSLSENGPPAPVEVIPRNTNGQYPWWGTTFAWSPDGQQLAYARADQIGVISLITTSATLSHTLTPLMDFTPLDTFSDWVWVPGLSWSPDGKFIAAVIHGPPLAQEPATESPVFDLWLFSVDGRISAKVAEQVGMWANPVWGPAGIAFGQAVNPLKSVNSRYSLQLMDRDGSNQRQIFPFQEEPGVQYPELAWSPTGKELLFIYNGNLHLTGPGGGVPKQLSIDGQASRPQWGVAASQTITSTFTTDLEEQMRRQPTVTPTRPRVTATPTATATRPATPTATATKPTATATATATKPKPKSTATATATKPKSTATATPVR